MTARRSAPVAAVRRACACGASLTASGPVGEVGRALLEAFARDHDPAKPGHDPTSRPPSQDGRAPRTRRTR